MPISSDIPDFTNWQDSTSTRAPLPPGGNVGPAVDPYDGPDSPPRVAQNVSPPLLIDPYLSKLNIRQRQESSKRPVEPNSNNNRRLKMPKPNLSKDKQAVSSTTTTTTTKSGRPVRQRSFPDRSTDEQVEAAVGSSSSSASQEGSYTNRRQQGQIKDSTYRSASATALDPEISSSRTSQPTPRAEAVRLATEQAERVAEQVQTVVMGQTSGSAVAQQQGPSVVPVTTSLPQSRTDAEISQVPLTAPRAIPGQAPRSQMRPNQFQRKAISACSITYRSSIGYNGTVHSVMTFEPSIFQISLDDLVRALNLNNDFGTFYIAFDTIEEGVYPYGVSNQDDFETFRVECLTMITNYYQRSQLIPEAERQLKRYRVLFSRTNNTA